jgi:hypothetical protein
MNGLGTSAGMVGTIAEGERVEIHASADDSRRRAERERLSAGNLPAHQFPAMVEAGPQAVAALQRRQEEDREREQRIYRGRTVGMLRRYLRYSIEAGRLPSMLGSEFFRAKVTTYTVVTFEDRVIFVHDMEKCLDRLDEFSRQLIARNILQEHDLEATGRLLGCNERTVRTYVPIVLDVFSEILLEVGLLERVESSRENSCPNSCQGGLESESSASTCDDGKYKV